MHHIITQYMIEMGMQRYKERGTKGVNTELNKTHDKLTFTTIKNIPLTQRQSTDALRVLMLLKAKRCGKIRFLMCTYFCKQKNIPNKLDDTFPIVATKSVLITTDIDESEYLDVAFVGILGALLTADMDEEVILVTKIVLVNIIVDIFPRTYREYEYIGKNGRKILYMRHHKFLYGCLCRDILFY